MAFNMESIQKRVMCIIFPTHDYNEALSALSLTTLNERRVHLCQVYVARSPRTKTTRYQERMIILPLHIILPILEEVQHDYYLKSGASYRLRPVCKTKRPSALKILSLLSIILNVVSS